MAKHGWDRARHGKPPNDRTSWKYVLGTMFAMLMLIVGPQVFAHSASCDHKPMAQQDRCVHHGRSSERLIPAADEHAPNEGCTYTGQVVFNRVLGAVLAIMGVGAWIVAIVWSWRRLKNWRIDRRTGRSLSADSQALTHP